METGLEGKAWWVGVAIGVGLGVAGVLLGYQLQLKEMHAQRERNNGQIVELQGKISRGLAAKAKLPQFREEVALLEVQLEKLLRILPPRRDVQDVLRRFRALAEQEDFVLSEFRPGQEAQKDFYNEWPITVRISGTYHNLARFFDRMSRFSRIFNVDNLQITQSRAAGQHTIAASFTAKTFVYQETEPEPATGTTAPGQGGGAGR
ncbi:MAG TPA: type 4a pilus biogenesis protein PilO [Thermoanaerobaculia bacterium]|nr:type 4a pilus biogenesis protein PilO [Thermoanaerobaculia bacterium]